MKKFLKRGIILILTLTMIVVSCPLSALAYAKTQSVREHTAHAELLQEGAFPVVLETSYERSGDTTKSADTEQQINDTTKAVYDALTAVQASVDLTSLKITPETLNTVFSNLINSCPELFYVSSEYSYSAYGDGTICEIMFKYTLQGKELEDARIFFADSINSIIAAIDPGFSDLEKIIFVHDYIATHFCYDERIYDTEQFKNAVYNVYEFFKQGTGVCQAYALLFTTVMNRLEIETTYASSDDMNHIWNLVKLEDEWYHVDVTFDDPIKDVPGRCSHEYLLLTDTEISTDTNRPHYGWTTTEEIVCDSNSFSEACWRTASSSLVRADGWYYFEGFDLYKADINTNSTEKIYTIENKWPVRAQEDTFYNNCFASVFAFENNIYFNEKDKICKYDVTTKTVSTLLPYSSTTDDVYAATLNDNIITYYTHDDPNNIPAGAKHTYELNPLYFYKLNEIGVSSFYCETFADCLTLINNAESDYIISLYRGDADYTGISGTLPAAKSISFECESGILEISGTLTANSDIILDGLKLTATENTNAVISLGAHGMALNGGSCAVDIDGSEGSSLTTVTEKDALTGKITVDIFNLGNDITLSNDLIVNKINGEYTITLPIINVASELTMPTLNISGKCDAAIAVNAVCTTEKSVDLCEFWSYTLPLFTAKELSPEKVTLTVKINEAYSEDCTRYCSFDKDGGYIRALDEEYVIDGTNLTGYYTRRTAASVTIPDSVKHIISSAFAGNGNIISVFIPHTVSSIDDNAFTGCDKLTEIIFDGSIKDLIAVTGSDKLPAAKLKYTVPTLNAEVGGFTGLIDIKEPEGETHAVRFVMALNLLSEELPESKVTIEFKKDSETVRKYDFVLSETTEDFDFFLRATAYGKDFEAAENCAVFGVSVINIPEDAWQTATLTISDATGTVLSLSQTAN